jgi:hypothetical protein
LRPLHVHADFQLLLALLERRGELVTRDALRQRLWPGDTFVGFEHGLNAAIKRLRNALRDSPAPRYRSSPTDRAGGTRPLAGLAQGRQAGSRAAACTSHAILAGEVLARRAVDQLRRRARERERRSRDGHHARRRCRCGRVDTDFRRVGEPFQITRFDSPAYMIDPDVGVMEMDIAERRLALTMRTVSGSIWMLSGVDD